MEDVFSITQKTVVGPRDRIRKFNELDFTYIAPMKDNSNLAESGFHCKPGGLKYMEFNKDSLGGIFDKGTEAEYSLVVNLLFFPLLCSQILNVYGLIKDDDSGFKTFFILLASVFGFKSLEYLESMIFDEDDFNLDPYNSYCFGVGLSMIVVCLTIMIIAKIKYISLSIRVAIIVGLDVAGNVVKEAFKGIQFAIADAVFGNFELCGDNWLTYGNESIEANLNGQSVEKSTYSNWENWEKYISEAYPSKGAFNGSYKYKINKCFMENNINYCKVLYQDTNLSSESVITKINIFYKPYREFIYDGMEFSYSGCSDPRPERKSYLDVNDKISQLYYFRGNEAANFACDRFLVSANEDYREAYKCCLEASQKLICIHNTVEKKHVMCNKDDDSSCKMDYTLDNFGDRILKIVGLNNLADFLKKLEENKNKQQTNSIDSDFCKNLKEATVDKFCKDNSDPFNCNSVRRTYDEHCDENGKPKPGVISSSNISSSENNNKDRVLDIDHTIKFKIRQSTLDPTGNKYCVETYNLCPYNFRILGGTEQYGNEFAMKNDSGFKVKKVGNDGEYEQDDPNDSDEDFNENNHCTFDKEGGRHCTGPCMRDDKIYACYNKPSNFCQIDRHCVNIQPLVKTENNALSPYIDRACLDNIGSSHNFLNYEKPLAKSGKNQKVLVAPMVECVVETFKNILLNKAGHTICKNMNDKVIGDVCLNSDVVIKQGDDLSKSDYESPFIKIKTYLGNIVKAILVLSVMLYGYNIILFRKGTNPEEIFKYVITISLVVYFSFSNNWINNLFNSVYNIYNKVSEFAVNILSEDRESYNYDNPKYGGCFFFDALYINNKYDDYKDRKYLAVFDTFDCKLSRYFGYYSDNIGNPPIISIFIMGIFMAGLSILVMLPFALLFISILFFIIRVAYIFVVNSLTITILLFMTPIFVPMILFDRTKGFFQNWLKKILQNIMSPLFIFMALSLFLTVFDKYFVSNAIFYGENEPIRGVYCDTICRISENNYFHLDPEKNEQRESCNESKGKIIDLKKNAPICAVQDPGVSNKTGVGLIDFIIEDFPGLPGLPNFSGLTDQIEGFFNMFFDLIFLLILIFIFEQFISYVNAMTGAIFSPDGSGGGAMNDTSGLPSLQDVTQIVASSGVKLANSSSNVVKNTSEMVYDKFKKRNDNK